MSKSIDPAMHSAEHLLNQAMVQRFGTSRCFSAHIEKKKSKCDYRFHRPLTDAELRLLEADINRVIEQDLEIREELLPIDSARRQYDLSRLPATAPASVRIVHMGDYDACPCIGEHLPRTGGIGHFRISTSSFSDGVLRIRFKRSPGAPPESTG
jgi:alanyl-tRNA synthetase